MKKYFAHSVMLIFCFIVSILAGFSQNSATIKFEYENAFKRSYGSNKAYIVLSRVNPNTSYNSFDVVTISSKVTTTSTRYKNKKKIPVILQQISEIDCDTLEICHQRYIKNSEIKIEKIPTYYIIGKGRLIKKFSPNKNSDPNVEDFGTCYDTKWSRKYMRQEITKEFFEYLLNRCPKKFVKVERNSSDVHNLDKDKEPSVISRILLGI